MSGYRSRCLEQKGRSCQICASDGYVEVHHVDGDRGNNSLSNLIPVCMECHSKIHRGDDGYEKWYNKLSPSAKQNADIRPTDDGGLADEVSRIVGSDIYVSTTSQKLRALDEIINYCENRITGRVTSPERDKEQIKRLNRFVSRISRGVYCAQDGQIELTEFK